MGFSSPGATAPVYNAPNLGPLIDFQLANLPSDSFGKLPVVTTAPQSHYLPLLGNRALFTPINNVTTTTRLLQLTDYSQYALAAMPANCLQSMCSVPVSGRYIYMPQGFSASGVRGSGFYRYDPWLDAWATMAAITTLNASYRFGTTVGTLSDGGDYIYVFGGYDGTADRATFRYSISGDSWAELALPPGLFSPRGGLEGPVGDYIYTLHNGSSADLYRYSISGDSWATMTSAPGAHTRGGLVQDPANTDLLYAIGGSGGTGRIHRYSISGDAWTTLTGTGMPGDVWAKGIFFPTPIPCILLPRVSTTQMWVYKV